MHTGTPSPDEKSPRQLHPDPVLDRDPRLEKTTVPLTPVVNIKPEYLLRTIDSLGDADPALVAHAKLPVVFVFNEDVVRELQLSSRRIDFHLETLQDLSGRTTLTLYLGDPYLFAHQNKVAVTFAPVPSFEKMPEAAELHPHHGYGHPNQDL
jgi:deoxyribodipyrimidine photo-lyase